MYVICIQNSTYSRLSYIILHYMKLCYRYIYLGKFSYFTNLNSSATPLPFPPAHAPRADNLNSSAIWG